MENKGNNNSNNNNGGNNNNNKNGMTVMIFILAALLVLFLTSLLNSCAKDATNKEITYSEFIDMVEKDKVESVTFTSNKINITPKNDNKLYRITYYTAELNDEELLPLLKEHDVKFGGTVEDVSSAIMWNMVSYILPLVLVWILLYFLIFRKMGSGGMMGVGKTTAKVYVEKSTGVTFKDVAGQNEAKESLQEVVDFLHNPKKYTDIGAKLPKGALLVGPPGTGKTLLAKAVAGEAKVPFFSLAGSDFVEMFVGVGASRVRDLFKEAQKQAPCIIFIDEIDAIGKSRDTRYGGNDEREQTLNQLLAEMDGFDTSKGLLILAATNRPEVLDKALLRPGRFDRRIIVDKPDLKGRVDTLKVHAKNVLLDESVDLDAIALATSGAVGSDLANMINEAAINAVKHGRKYVNQSDLFESVEVVIAGKEKKDRIMGPKEKKMVAYHEVGHALVTALQKDAEPVQKITIVPRTMGALGYTMQVPEEEKFLMTKKELVAHLITYMGGRAAEEIVFDSVTTGASNDIEQATKIARAMVTQYGMSEKFGLMGLVTIENQYLDGRASLNCGEETAAQIDKEVMRILKESYDEAVRLLQENRDILDKISQHLYEHETITGKEFMKIFRELKGIPEPEEKTEAEKAAEEFKAEEVHSREFQQPESRRQKEHSGHQKREEAGAEDSRNNAGAEEKIHLETDAWKELSPETIMSEEGSLEVNTLKEEDLPLEIYKPSEESFLEVNTLEGEEIPQELRDFREEEISVSNRGQKEELEENSDFVEEKEIEIIPIVVNAPSQQKAFEQNSRTEKAQIVSENKTEELQTVSEQKNRPEEPESILEQKDKPEKPESILEQKNEPEEFKNAVEKKDKPEEPKNILEQKKLEEPKSVPEQKKKPEESRDVSQKEDKPEKKEEEIGTPEEWGFFPAKKGSSRKIKSSANAVKPDIAEPSGEILQEEIREETHQEEPDSGEGEDYLDKLLKGLK